MENQDIEKLIENANADGAISGASMAVLRVNDIGEQILAAMGQGIEEAPTSEMVLVTMLIDDSGSIDFSNNADMIRDGHNMVIDSLSRAQQADNILAHNRYLNGEILYPYCPIPRAVKMTGKNYDPKLGTPLYDQAAVVLGTVIAKAQSFADNGIPVRTITLILTDGEDAHSVKANAKSVSKIVKDMLKTENHIIAAMGVQNNSGTNFRQVFTEMGIEDKWILTPGNSKGEVQKAFNLFSRSAVTVSQCSGPLKQVSLGGFGS